ncbi:MAG TPA: hypothetical protein VH561_05470 [Micromonosporaceae bacterium]|jgi:hypothetical protein
MTVTTDVRQHPWATVLLDEGKEVVAYRGCKGSMVGTAYALDDGAVDCVDCGRMFPLSAKTRLSVEMLEALAARP